jgi:hypothetical protein
MKAGRIISLTALILGIGTVAIPMSEAVDQTAAAMATPHTTWARGSDVPDVPVAPGPQGL